MKVILNILTTKKCHTLPLSLHYISNVSSRLNNCFCFKDGDPVRPGLAMTDLATGLYTHGAVMAALLQRQRTGRGLHIDCNLLSSQVRNY